MSEAVMRQPYFETVLALLLKHEGGYSNHPEDRGGATHYGITQAVYDAYQKRTGQSALRSVKHITPAEVREIYQTQYAKPIRFELLPRGLDYVLFDFAVNSGVARAVKTLQRILGVREDGIVGQMTLASLQNQDPKALCVALCAARRQFVRRLKNYKTFGRGWERRINEVEQSALNFIERGELPPPTPSATHALEAAPKADGERSFKGALLSSSSTQAAVLGTLGVAVSSVPEAVNMARPAHEALGVGLSHWVGVLITLAALGFIVWQKLRVQA